ncbi:MAG: Ig-like domain-containing protein, partial [Planctomycetota bacterium]
MSTILLSVAAGMATGAPVPPPSYTAAGSLTDPNGAPVYPAWVGAYDAESGSLLQIVDVEPSGSYVIPGLPRTVQLLAKPYFGSPLAAQWLFDQDLSTTQTESFELEIGAPVTFTLRDRQGNPVEGAEVRAYPAQAHRLDGKGIIDFALTDANGTATIIAPTFSHLVADGSQLGYLPSWRFNRRLSTAGTSLDFTIDVGTPV